MSDNNFGQPQLIRVLTNPDFDSSKFVKDIYQSGDENDLLDAKIRAQHLYDETAQLLKKNVYKNNAIFIDTARDVSYLESEMYQLNHLLNEQKNVLNNLEALSILNIKYTIPKADRDNESKDSSRILFSNIYQDIEGNQNILMYKNQKIWFQGELLQIEETQAGKFIPIQKCHCFVLDEVFILCSIITKTFVSASSPRHSLLYNAYSEQNKTMTPNDTTFSRTNGDTDAKPKQMAGGGSAGNRVLKFQHCYPLISLAVINVKDDQSALVGAVPTSRQAEPVSGLLKFLLFPETLILKARDDKTKREWIQAIDSAKKAPLKGIEGANQSSPLPPPSSKILDDTKGRESSRINIRETLPTDGLANLALGGREKGTLDDWILDFQDELDMFIAQRQFDDAVDLIEKVKPILTDNMPHNFSGPILDELRNQLSQLTDRLVDTLYSEITGSDDSDDNLNIIGKSGTYAQSPNTANNKSGREASISNSFFGVTLSTSPPSTSGLSTLRYRPPRTLVARAVLLLIRLGKANQARSLYLANRSALIRHRLADLKLEGNLALYIEKLGNVFFGIVAETRDEIDLYFCTPLQPLPPPRSSRTNLNNATNKKSKGLVDQSDLSASLANFAVWLSKSELKNFVGYVLRQIEGIRTNFSLVVRCLAVSRSQCLMLADSSSINLDIIYAFDSLTNQAVAKMTEEQTEKISEASRAKICEDDWTAQGFLSKEALEKFVADLEELGFSPLTKIVLPYSARATTPNKNVRGGESENSVNNYQLIDYNGFRCNLARSSTTFLKIFINFLRDLTLIYTPERHKIFRDALLHAFLNHLQYLTVYLKSPKFKNAPGCYELIHANARFMLRCLVPLLNDLWSGVVGYRDDFKTLDVTVEDILEISGNPPSNTDNIPDKKSTEGTNRSINYV